MKKVQELTLNQLAMPYDSSVVLKMSTNAEKIFPGNSKIRLALRTILDTQDERHIYLSTNSGTNANNFLVEYIKQIRKTENFDWCYIYNFEDPTMPKLIMLKAGQGKVLKKVLDESIKGALNEIIRYFGDREYREIERALKQDVLNKCEKALESLRTMAKEMGFATHVTEKGIFFIPIVNGKKISENEYDKLDASEQEAIIKDLNRIEEKSDAIMKKIRKMKKDLKSKILQLKRRIIQELVDQNFEKVSDIFISHTEVMEYVDYLKKNLNTKLSKVLLNLSKEDLEKMDELINADNFDTENKFKYVVNLLKSCSDKFAPVVCGYKVGYYDLFGKIEYEGDSSSLSTDFTLIQPGLIHLANGGFLILDVLDLLQNRFMWEKLKKVLVEKSIAFDNMREQLGALPIKTIVPEKMPLNLKVILVGDEYLYHALYEYDSEFKEIFGYHIMLPDEVEANEANLSEYAAYLKRDNVTDKAVMRVIFNGILKTGNRSKISTQLSEMERLIDIAKVFAKRDKSDVIDEKHIIEAENEINGYYDHYKKSLDELVQKNHLIFEVSGKKIGQVNALSVGRYTDFTLAYPIRLTALTYAGEEGIISIEKENKMSGKIFGKGLSIISAFIHNQLANDKPLSVNCLLCCEQIYGDIDGDSASCAEVFAIVSALAKIPIQQGIAVTGSMDQFGNVQPIGCVSEKITGFYNVCKLKKLEGQGVIVPYQNVDEIVLSDEIMKAISDGLFHIYPIKRIEEGIALLMNADFEKIKKIIRNSLDEN